MWISINILLLSPQTRLDVFKTFALIKSKTPSWGQNQCGSCLWFWRFCPETLHYHPLHSLDVYLLTPPLTITITIFCCLKPSAFGLPPSPPPPDINHDMTVILHILLPSQYGAEPMTYTIMNLSVVLHRCTLQTFIPGDWAVSSHHIILINSFEIALVISTTVKHRNTVCQIITHE